MASTELRAAAQQALKILELEGSGYPSPKTAEAITALRAALAEPENWELRRLREELERCKQVCAATSEAWREEAALAEPVPGQGCEHCNQPLYAAIKCRVCGRVTEPAQEPVEWSHINGTSDTKWQPQRPAEPVQEPVAWMTVRLNVPIQTTARKDVADEWLKWGEVLPLYTAPQQRNPVGWDGRCMLGHCNSPAGCENSGECRAAERAHGIGGEG